MMFSILIPVYNTQRYLKECLDSVLAQDFADYEVILVNDGSTDDSDLICQEYAKQDTRIKYFCKENEGLLLTRRYSLKKACGDYILFLDSDDYWKPNLLSRIEKKIKETDVDMLLFRYCGIRDNGKFIYDDMGVFPDGSLFCKENKDKVIEIFVSTYKINTLWSKCVKKSIIDIDADYSMFRDKKGEDALQSAVLLKNAKTIYYMDDVLYCYRQSVNGRSRNFKYKYFRDLDVVNKYIFDTLEVGKLENTIGVKAYVCYLLGVFYYFYLYTDCCKNFDEFYNGIYKIKDYLFLNEALKNVKMMDMKDVNSKFTYYLWVNKRYRIIYIKCKIQRLVQGLKKMIRNI